MLTRTCISCVLIISLLSGCSVGQKVKTGEQLALQYGFEQKYYRTNLFTIVSLQKNISPNTTVTIYIEGDGRAWRNRRRVSANPTPADPIGLKLASVDSNNDIIYLARPCQFIDLEREQHCQPEYWTSKRAGKEVVNALNDVVSTIKNEYDYEHVRLIGYSGGATIAAILAATRDDVIEFRSVAGNLDIAKFADYHNVTPLNGSINPVSLADKLVFVPQKHFFSSDDTVVVPKIIESYLASLAIFDPQLRCVMKAVLSGITHSKGWEAYWQQQTHKRVLCRQ